MRILIAALAASLAACPALAQQLPNMVPDHDVTGTYIATGNDGAKSMAVEFSKSADTLRLTMPQGQGYILYDFGTKDAKMVMPQMQRYMDYSAMAAGFAAMAQPHSATTAGDDVSISQGGTETIAGHECQDTIATDHTKNQSATFCITDDHVILSMTDTKGFSLVAQSVSYDDVPAADVEVPPGYTEFVMPQMPAGVGNMPPSAMNGQPLPGGQP